MYSCPCFRARCVQLDRAPSSRAAAGRTLRVRLENRSRRWPRPLSLDGFVASLPRHDDTGRLKTAPGSDERSFSARHFLATASDGHADDGATTMGKASQATLGPGGHWRNWVGNQSFIARHKAEPASEDELAALVREAGRRDLPIRVAGSGHSFTPL